MGNKQSRSTVIWQSHDTSQEENSEKYLQMLTEDLLLELKNDIKEQVEDKDTPVYYIRTKASYHFIGKYCYTSRYEKNLSGPLDRTIYNPSNCYKHLHSFIKTYLKKPYTLSFTGWGNSTIEIHVVEFPEGSASNDKTIKGEV